MQIDEVQILAEFTPEGLLETELVETMAAARWRLRRVSTIETTLLTMEMVRGGGAVGFGAVDAGGGGFGGGDYRHLVCGPLGERVRGD